MRLNQKGAVSILALFMIPLLFAIAAMGVDIGQVICTKIIVKHKLNLALRGAVGIDQLDKAALQDAHNPRIVIDEELAKDKFMEILKINLRLDDSLQPMAGSPCDGKVTIDYLKVVNEDEIPFTYKYNEYTETLNKPGMIGIISFPYKNSFLSQMAGVPEEVPMTVHVTVSPELVSRHLEDWQ